MDKSVGIYELVNSILATIPEPYSEDVILNVFQKIQKNPDWLKRYNQLLLEHNTNRVVNPWIGKYTKRLTGMKNLVRADAHGTTLVKRYTKLTH